MKYWIQPSNPHGYDANTALEEDGFITCWPTRYHMEIGDIVFLYISSPIKEIRWKCVVGDNDYWCEREHESYPEDEMEFRDCNPLAYQPPEGITREDPGNTKAVKELWNHINNGPDTEVAFVAVHKYEHPELLSYEVLRQHGLNGTIMGAIKAKGELLDYILSVEKVRMPAEEPEEYIEEKPPHRQKPPKEGGYVRNKSVSDEVKEKADGYCELCGNFAPFFGATGKPYLEAHHVIPLSEGGYDNVKNVVALCPNCHRKLHHAALIDTANDIEYLLLKAKTH